VVIAEGWEKEGRDAEEAKVTTQIADEYVRLYPTCMIN